MKIRLLFITSVLLVCVCRAETSADYDAGPAGVELPKSAKELLIAKLDAKKISGVSRIVFRRLHDFDYLAIEAGFEVPWHWEKAFIHDFILRKKASDPDWSKAELFDASEPEAAALCYIPDESQLRRWKNPSPAQTH
ncbi:MAG TPA: hypothetical protein VKE30_04120 [Chthoniobacterales bacterium]|nr:hypothetical protein [Chthoniobacterales bacterium]